jgi:hypothetical protein
MNRTWLAIGASTAVLALSVATIDASGDASTDGARLVGSWSGTATATSVPLPPLKDLITFTNDGSVLETHRSYLKESPLGPVLATSGHGSWARTGANEYAATLAIIYEGAPDHPTDAGSVLATETVRFKLRLTPDNGTLTGRLIDEIRDLDDNIIFSGPGRFEASRIPVRPLP